MAYVPGNLALLATANGFKTFRYDSTDAITAVDVPGYFNNKDDLVNLQPGDIIEVVVWGTAVRTGTVDDWGSVIVRSVNATTGAVTTSTDQLAGTMADGS